MKLPSKVEYACQVLIQLVPTAVTGQVVPAEELATKEKLSQNYLFQILNELRNAGLVTSKRGKNGGYTLAKKPDEITLEQIVKAVEGSFLELDAGNDGESSTLVISTWTEVIDSMKSLMMGKTLSAMAEKPFTPMYHI